MLQSEEILDRQTDLALQVFDAARAADKATLPIGQERYELTEYQALESHIIGLLNAAAVNVCVLRGIPLNKHGIPCDTDKLKEIGDALVNLANEFVFKGRD